MASDDLTQLNFRNTRRIFRKSRRPASIVIDGFVLKYISTSCIISCLMSFVFKPIPIDSDTSNSISSLERFSTLEFDLSAPIYVYDARIIVLKNIQMKIKINLYYTHYVSHIYLPNCNADGDEIEFGLAQLSPA